MDFQNKFFSADECSTPHSLRITRRLPTSCYARPRNPLIPHHNHTVETHEICERTHDPIFTCGGHAFHAPRTHTSYEHLQSHARSFRVHEGSPSSLPTRTSAARTRMPRTLCVVPTFLRHVFAAESDPTTTHSMPPTTRAREHPEAPERSAHDHGRPSGSPPARATALCARACVLVPDQRGGHRRVLAATQPHNTMHHARRAATLNERDEPSAARSTNVMNQCTSAREVQGAGFRHQCVRTRGLPVKHPQNYTGSGHCDLL